MKTIQLTALVTGLSLYLGTFATASQSMQRHMSGMNSGLSAQDKRYLDEAAQTNIGEIKILTLVEKKAQWPASKLLAKSYAKAHMTAQRKLEQLATTYHYTLPTDVSLKQKASTMYLSLQPKSHFDSTYRSEMIQGHKQAIADTKTELVQGNSPAVKAYANQILPDLRMHLSLAKSLPSGSTMKQASR
jgi:putative membrane protein